MFEHVAPAQAGVGMSQNDKPALARAGTRELYQSRMLRYFCENTSRPMM